VISAKKQETRLKRLTQLIEDSEHERTIRELRRATARSEIDFGSILGGAGLRLHLRPDIERL